MRLLRKNNHQIKVIMTHAAQQFITPLTMRTLTANTVYTKMFNQEQKFDLEHIVKISILLFLFNFNFVQSFQIQHKIPKNPS